MTGKTLKSFIYILFVSCFIIPLFLLIYNVYWLISRPVGDEAILPEIQSHLSLIKIESVFLFFVLLFLLASFIYTYRYILLPLIKIKEGVRAIKEGEVPQKLELDREDEIGEIAAAVNHLSDNLLQSYKTLETQAHELNGKNWELREANLELEASHGQLQAIIQQLNESEQKYHSLVRNIPEIVCVIDNSGHISFINHICLEILGYDKSELVGTNLLNLVNRRMTSLRFDEVLKSLKEHNTITVELPLVKKTGETILTEANITNYIFNGVYMGVQAIVRDITHKRKMEEEIVQSNKELAILNFVSKSLTSTLELDDLCKSVVEKVSDALGLQGCVLRLLDSTGTQLVARAYSGEYFEWVKDLEDLGVIGVHDEIIEPVINQGQIVKLDYIPDRWRSSEVNNQKPENEKLKGFLSVPLNCKDKKIGILSVGSSSSIKQNTVSLISSIANNAAVAIDNALLYDTSRNYFIRTIDALIAAVEAKDKYTEGHSQRVSRYAVEIAKKLGLSREQIEDIKIAGILHDIGKIGISDTILSKPGKLSDEEYEEVKKHPVISNKILYPVGFSQRTLKAIKFHHERYDGKGYPYGLKGDDISIEAQIIAVADAYDAMTSSRSYRRAMSFNDAIKELAANRSTQFNPRVVDAALEIRERLIQG